MSEAKNRVKERDTEGGFYQEITKEYLLQLFMEKFEELAPICRDRVVSPNASAICMYHGSSSTDCRFAICPKIDLPLDDAAEILEGEEGGKNESSTP